MRLRDENKENVIREKAFEMIVKFGFDGFSMHKLAKSANVSAATIYIYYKNREDLLNRLYNHAFAKLTQVSLLNFSPDHSLEEGLWLQWKNRFKFISEYPVYYSFIEQFRNSPLINHKDIDKSEFKENMRLFVANAIKRGELRKMQPEIFWAVAYGAFYTLVKFHLYNCSMMGSEFALKESTLKEVHKMILKALDNG
jgi:TetR/AcrR family transcriptional regulator, multidrug resistance operon repressor